MACTWKLLKTGVWGIATAVNGSILASRNSGLGRIVFGGATVLTGVLLLRQGLQTKNCLVTEGRLKKLEKK